MRPQCVHSNASVAISILPAPHSSLCSFRKRCLSATWASRASTSTSEAESCRVTATATERDDSARRQVTVLRYEVVDGGISQVVERPWILHWHTQSGFADLAVEAGLRVEAVLAPDGSPAALDATEFGFVLRRADAPTD